MVKNEISIEERYSLITKNLQEVINEEELKSLLKEKKFISVYWGTMPTGSISIAYFFPMLKIADFLEAGLKVKILIADLHAALDSVPWEILEKRYDYYKEGIIKLLQVIGVDIKNLEFVKGSEIQLKEKYFNDLLKLSTITSMRDAKKSASEGIKSALGDQAKLSGFIYPLMQALDEEYLKVDIQFAGVDQRKIMVYARENLPKIGYKARIELMNPMIRGLVGVKMSSSDERTKIDLLSSKEEIIRKINGAECEQGNPENGIMALLKYLIFGVKNHEDNFIISRPEKYGGDLNYSSYESLEKDFINKKIHPLDLKNAVANELVEILRPFREDKKLAELHKKAYAQK